jgi:YebC/PmpR family DNA-binding regulatory protein
MSGHSKWSQIKRSKGASDVKRGILFSKLSKKISLAVKEGGGSSEPAGNLKLRAAIDKAKEASMPNDNIERAIKKGLGEGGRTIEEVIYEGYGPFGTAFLIEAATDNKNRTVQSVKHILSVHGGNLGGQGSVAWQFQTRGQILVERGSSKKDLAELELAAIDAGAEDVRESAEGLEIYTQPADLDTVKNKISEAGGQIAQAEIIKESTQGVDLTDDQRPKVDALFAELENNEDVIGVHTSANL